MPADVQALLVSLTVAVVDELRSEIQTAVRQGVEQALCALSVRGPPIKGEVKPEVLVVTTARAAEMLSVPKAKIFQLMRAGTLESFRAGKRTWRITAASIQSYIATQAALHQVSEEASERARELRARRGVKKAVRPVAASGPPDLRRKGVTVAA